jgi:hypothetical protein
MNRLRMLPFHMNATPFKFTRSVLNPYSLLVTHFCFHAINLRDIRFLPQAQLQHSEEQQRDAQQ